MDKLVSRITAWWQPLSRREQRMLLIMLTVLGGLGYYLLIWQPLQQHRHKMQRQLPALSAELQQVREMARQATALKDRPTLVAMPAAQLQSLLQQQLGALGPGLQFTTEGEHAVRVKGELGFADWAGMQGSLASQQIHALSLHLSPASVDGKVRLDVLLSHAASG